MKKVLILMAERTGTGHKSAANAIEMELKSLGYETKQIDCFNMLKGFLGKMLENSYIPITTNVQYYFTYHICYFLRLFQVCSTFFCISIQKKDLKKNLMNISLI